MPLKEIKDPGKKEEKKKTSSSKPKETAEPTSSQDPWKYNPDGSKVRQGRKLPYENQLHQLFTEVSGAVKMADAFSGAAIEFRAEELAYGYAKLAKEEPAIKAFFERILQGSAYSAVIVPTALTAIPILWHFGLMPAKVGVPVTFASGLPLMTREQERAAKDKAAADQRQAEEAERNAATHPRGENPGDGDSA